MLFLLILKILKMSLFLKRCRKSACRVKPELTISRASDRKNALPDAVKCYFFNKNLSNSSLAELSNSSNSYGS